MKNILLKLFIALVCGGLSALLAGYIFSNRDFLFEWNRTSGSGKFNDSRDEKLRVAARDFAEARLPGKVCVDKWLGKDDKYLYMTIGCATFRETLGEVHSLGDGNFVPTRLRYSGEKIEGMEQPEPGALENSLHRLFPKEAAEKLRFGQSQPEYRRLGLLRMAERGLSTMKP